MEKDIVTRENIKKDNKFWLRLTLAFLFGLIVFILISMYLAVNISKKPTALVVILIFGLLVSIAFLIGFIYFLYMHIKSQQNFIIVKDIFASMTSRIDFRDKEIRFFSVYMCFSMHGNFPLRYSPFPGQGEDFYRWSKFNHMWCDGLKRTSVPGDEFYLVMYKNRILAVYNTKLFELNKDLKVME